MSEDIRQALVELLPRLRRLALSLCADRDEADDLVQAVCERALSRQHQYQAGTQLHSWLFRIAHSLWIDRLRAQRVRGASIDPQTVEATLSSEDLRAEQQQTLRLVLWAIAQLPEDQRAVLVLVSIDGLSYQETAHILEIPQGTVMSRLARARKRLHALTDADAKEQSKKTTNRSV